MYTMHFQMYAEVIPGPNVFSREASDDDDDVNYRNFCARTK